MHSHDLERWQHDHGFVATGESRAERRTKIVLAITAVTMVFEIVAGTLSGSMALLTDGWHMGTHGAAFAVTLFAYWYARRHARDERYTFGTGKVGALGGFASAVGLAVVAIGIGAESLARLLHPSDIEYGMALWASGLGLAVNLVCALLLGGAGHSQSHEHHASDHEHHASSARYGHDHEHHAHDHQDQNLRGAYLHVVADALTSVLAIGALLIARATGWTWLDAGVGLVGAVLIGRWAVTLLRDTSHVLLDAEAAVSQRRAIVEAIEAGTEDKVVDLHVWRVGPTHLAAMVSVVGHADTTPERTKARLAHFPDLAHVTVEVLQCERAGSPPVVP